MKKTNITIIDDDSHIACNKACAAIKEKGLPQQRIWLYISHLIQNIEHEEDLTLEQQETIIALFDEYLKLVKKQQTSEVIQQQGLHFLEEINQMRNSRLEKKLKEEQIFIEDLLLTISQYLEQIYVGLHSEETTAIIETFKKETIHAIYKAPDRKKIINLVETSFDRVNIAVEANIATIRSSVESMLKLESKTLLDTLTGLFNRRFYDQQLPKIIKAFCKFKGEKPFSLLTIDIDNFKQVNDTYGHLLGDVALQRVAQIIQKNCRAGIDSPIRNGGDEFVLFLIGADEKIALEKATSILTETANTPVTFSHQNDHDQTEQISFNLTLSIGVCELKYDWEQTPTKDLIHSVLYPNQKMKGYEKLTLKIIEAADMALYEAKKTGRNKVCVYS